MMPRPARGLFARALIRLKAVQSYPSQKVKDRAAHRDHDEIYLGSPRSWWPQWFC